MLPILLAVFMLLAPCAIGLLVVRFIALNVARAMHGRRRARRVRRPARA